MINSSDKFIDEVVSIGPNHLAISSNLYCCYDGYFNT